MPIRAILFDLDDTLIVDEAVSREAFRATAETAVAPVGADARELERSARQHALRLFEAGPVRPFCKRIGISAFECLWGRFLGESDDLTRLREWAHAYRTQVFDAALRDQAIESPDVAESLAAEFERQRRKLQRLMPDALEVLARLAPDYQIGLLTNGAPDLQREKLAASGLGGFFSAIAVSGEHDIGKPQAEIFHRLLAELATDPSDAVMVGNSLERDIAGARNAGIRSIWIRVPGSEESADVDPDHTIIGLAELPGILKSAAAPATSI